MYIYIYVCMYVWDYGCECVLVELARVSVGMCVDEC